ncbi:MULTISPECIES: RNA polymerase sigma factor [Bacillaceae]|uniref:RNA polymerase sigma factor n=1 Tax=Bacillaceae TaxID=186817 RepID=UPI002FFE6069
MNSPDFDELYSIYAKQMYYIALKYTREHYSAEDIVQEAFIKAYKKLDTVDDPQKLGGWLSVITARTAIDFLRFEKRRDWLLVDSAMMEPILGPDTLGISTEETVCIRLLQEEIGCSLGKLSSEFQEVLILKVQYGLKEHEIASLLNVKSATVKTRLYRARKQLKRKMPA